MLLRYNRLLPLFLVLAIFGIACRTYADIRCHNGNTYKFKEIELRGYKIVIISDTTVKSFDFCDVVPSSLPARIYNAVNKRLMHVHEQANKLYAAKKYSRAARYYKFLINCKAYLFYDQIRAMDAENIKQRSLGKFLYKKQWLTETEYKLVIQKEEAERKLVAQKKFEESQKAKGLTLYKGQWIPQAQADANEAIENAVTQANALNDSGKAAKLLSTAIENHSQATNLEKARTLKDKFEKIVAQKKFEESQKAKGLVLYEGQWISRVQADASTAIENAVTRANTLNDSDKAVKLLDTAMTNHPQAINLEKARTLKEKFGELIAQKKFEESQKAKGLTLYKGQWIPQAQADANTAIENAITQANSLSDFKKAAKLLGTAMENHPQATNLEKARTLKERLERPQTRIGIGARGELKPFKKLAFGRPKAKHDQMESVAFSPDGQWLVGGGHIGEGVGTIYLWDAGSGKLEREIKTQTETVKTISFSSDSKMLAISSGESPKTVLWDTGTWKLEKTITSEANVVAMALAPDGKTVAAATGTKNLELWDIPSARKLYVLKRPDFVTSLAYSPDGKRLAGGTRGAIFIWDVKTGKNLQKLRLPKSSSPAFHLAYSPDGKLLAEAGEDGTVRLWETSSGRLRRSLVKGSNYICFSVAFSPDSGSLISRAFSRPNGSDKGAMWLAFMTSGGAELWDVRSGTLRARVDGLAFVFSNTCSLAFSPDGQTLAVAESAGVNLFH